MISHIIFLQPLEERFKEYYEEVWVECVSLYGSSIDLYGGVIPKWLLANEVVDYV